MSLYAISAHVTEIQVVTQQLVEHNSLVPFFFTSVFRLLWVSISSLPQTCLGLKALIVVVVMSWFSNLQSL
jgi:hypothetical protein